MARARLVMVGAALALAATAGWLTYAVRRSHVTVTPAAIVVHAEAARFAERDGELVLRLEWQRGRDASVGVELRNSGPLPVQVTGVEVDDFPFALFALDRVLVGDSADLAAARPWHSFSLGRGDRRWIFLHYTATDCRRNEAGSTIGRRSIHVTSRRLGMFSDSRWLDLPATVTYVSPDECPGRP